MNQTPGSEIPKSHRKVRDHFNRQSRYTYEKFLGRGAFGETHLITHRRRIGPPRRLVVKRIIDKEDEGQLRSEIGILRLLGGAAHIVKLIAARDGTRAPRGFLLRAVSRLKQRVEDRINGPKYNRSSAFLIGFKGPVSIMEYLENGDLMRLLDRLGRADQALPNRVLWSFFLCLTRACVGMAYPQIRNDDPPLSLEVIPDNDISINGLVHDDFQWGNVMVGSAGYFPREHGIIPPLKLIDFGLARDVTEPESPFVPAKSATTAVMENMVSATRIVIGLIARRVVVGSVDNRDDFAIEIAPRTDGTPNPYPTLDPQLRRLLTRCLDPDHARRPTLAQLLGATLTAVQTKTPASFAPHAHLESDDAVRQVLQQFIYNADVQAPAV
ncbi:kinase-like domain-containing protein [Xylariaceae sp. FL1272]|nr:kinase-like domain-containing protein [Xylariaceae sp. FL1272]